MSWNKIIECVPNFSEGRDLEKIDQIVAPFRIKAGVKLLDYSNDEDHNRLVVTLVGEPEALYEAIVEAVGVAVRLIDLNQHTGQHPRMGAVDVIPFIPIKNTSMEEAIELSKKVAAKVAEIYHLPVFLYESPQLRRIGRISLLSVKENLKAWPKKSNYPSGNQISDLPNVIQPQVQSPSEPVCRSLPTISILVRTIWK